MLLAGILVFVRQEELAALLPLALAFLVTISGIIKLQYSVDLLRLKYEKWSVIFIIAIVNMVYGIILLINPFSTVSMLNTFLGVGFVLSGLTDVVVLVIVSKALIQKEEKEMALEGGEEEKKEK